MRSLDQFAETKLDRLDRQSLRRAPVETARGDFPYVWRAGRRLLSFSCNDYFGLSAHPAVKRAAVEAIERHGAGAAASRLVTGNHPLYERLESRIAALKGAEAACVFGSGYLANIGVLGALADPDDLIVIDELAHACLNAGARLSGARVARFRHNDFDHAAELMAAGRPSCRHALLVTETVFSMDGDVAPLAEFAGLCARHDAWLAVDDAHGFAILPHSDDDVPLQMGTLSKALGSYGGYLCASKPVIDLIKTRARSFIYTTGLPPASVAAALAALDVLAAEPERAKAPLRKARRFTDALGLPTARSAIVPLVLGTPEAALAASAALADAGFLVTAIRPPTVPAGTARLRFAFSAAHPDEAIDRLVATLQSFPWRPSEQARCTASS